MQVIYAAPFVLLSLICFAVFLAIPRLRRFAVSALIAPAAFGFCAIVGLVSWVLVCDYLLKIELGPMTGLRGAFEVLAFFIVPGVLGSSVAVWLVSKALQLWNIPIAPSWKERTSVAEAARSETI